MTAVTEHRNRSLPYGALSKVTRYVYICLEGDEQELRKAYGFTHFFDTRYSLVDFDEQRLFEELLRPLLTANDEETVRMKPLFSPYTDFTPLDSDYTAQILLPIAYALQHPDCPVELLTLATRHPWGFFRHHAAANPSCPEEDQVYAALLIRETS